MDPHDEALDTLLCFLATLVYDDRGLGGQSTVYQYLLAHLAQSESVICHVRTRTILWDAPLSMYLHSWCLANDMF